MLAEAMVLSYRTQILLPAAQVKKVLLNLGAKARSSPSLATYRPRRHGIPSFARRTCPHHRGHPAIDEHISLK